MLIIYFWVEFPPLFSSPWISRALQFGHSPCSKCTSLNNLTAKIRWPPISYSRILPNFIQLIRHFPSSQFQPMFRNFNASAKEFKAFCLIGFVDHSFAIIVRWKCFAIFLIIFLQIFIKTTVDWGMRPMEWWIVGQNGTIGKHCAEHCFFGN